MSTDRMGASAKADRATRPTGGSAKASPAEPSIPCAGAIGIVEHGLIRDGHEIVRVVKAGKLHGMWTVERYERAWLNRPEGWGSQGRRMVHSWVPLNLAPAVAHARIEGLSERMRAKEKAARQEYHEAVSELRDSDGSGEAGQTA